MKKRASNFWENEESQGQDGSGENLNNNGSQLA